MKCISSTLAAAVFCLVPVDTAFAFITPELLDPHAGSRALDRAAPGSGPLAPNAPEQLDVIEAYSVAVGEFTLDVVQGFGIEAVVLSRKEYLEGPLAALVPLDLALAWGPSSDPEWIRHLRIRQSARLYEWSFPRGTDLDESVVAQTSANMHIIPWGEHVISSLQTVGRGDLVRMSGFLVDVRAEGLLWETSRLRTDVGPGSCEIILVTSIEVVRGAADE